MKWFSSLYLSSFPGELFQETIRANALSPLRTFRKGGFGKCLCSLYLRSSWGTFSGDYTNCSVVNLVSIFGSGNLGG